tara:strand:+ start:3526 stop:3942 length:417 start_codon:yes stop_codon:yes gene_type:complete
VSKSPLLFIHKHVVVNLRKTKPSTKIERETKTQNIGTNGFRKREVVITTEEQYPQDILVEFIQDKCDLLNRYSIGQDVKININLRGKEWINSEGIAKYFNAIQGWRIEFLNLQEPMATDMPDIPPHVSFEDEDEDWPF